jgi:hypothetical protein
LGQVVRPIRFMQFSISGDNLDLNIPEDIEGELMLDTL